MIVVLLDFLLLFPHAFTSICELSRHTSLLTVFCVAFTCTCWNTMLTTLFYDGMDCDVNLTTFGTSDSIGPALHFWYSNLHWLLFCKCNARSCLKYWTSWHGYICRISTNGCNGCIFQKNETVTSVCSILIVMVFGTATFIQKKMSFLVLGQIYDT